MKKEDITTGMILEFETGKRALVLDNEFFIVNKNKQSSGSLAVSETIDVSLHINRVDYGDIVRIYKPETPENTNIGTSLLDFIFNNDWLTLIWERKVEEMTIEEICKELGRTIKIVGGN